MILILRLPPKFGRSSTSLLSQEGRTMLALCRKGAEAWDGDEETFDATACSTGS